MNPQKLVTASTCSNWITYYVCNWLTPVLTGSILNITVNMTECIRLTEFWAILCIFNDWLRAGRSGGRMPVAARFSATVQTGPGAHPSSCTMVTGSFLGVKCGRGVTLTSHPLLVPWSWKGRAIPLLPLWAVRPVQSLSACTRCALYLYFCALPLTLKLDVFFAVASYIRPIRRGVVTHRKTSSRKRIFFYLICYLKSWK